MLHHIGWGLVAGLGVAVWATPASALDLTVGSGAAQNCPAAGYAVSLDAAAVAYAQPMPVLRITDYGGGYYDPGAGNNIGIGIGYGELDANAFGLCVGALYRVEYYAEASRDLLDALVANHFGHPFDAGRTYELAMTEKSFKADGLRLRKAFGFELTDRWSMKLGVAGSFLRATEGEEQTLGGAVTATSPSYAVGTGTWQQTVSNIDYADFNPFVAPGTPRGDGFSSDLELALQSTAGMSADLIVMDALGRIYWREVPRSVQTLNNAAVAYNANFDRDAFINGVQSRVSFVQAIPTKLHLAVSVPVIAQWHADLEDDEVQGFHFPAAGASFGDGTHLALLHYDFRTKAVQLGGRLHWLSASLTTNNVRFDRASALGLSIQALCAW